MKAKVQIFTVTGFRSQPHSETKTCFVLGIHSSSTGPPLNRSRESLRSKFSVMMELWMSLPVTVCSAVAMCSFSNSPTPSPEFFIHTKWERQAQRGRGNGAAWALLYTGLAGKPHRVFVIRLFHFFNDAGGSGCRLTGDETRAQKIQIVMRFLEDFGQVASDNSGFSLLWVASVTSERKCCRKPHDESQEDNDNPRAYGSVRAHSFH